MRKVFNIFKIKREERWQALVALLLFTVLNALTIIKYNSQFIQLTDNYHKLFVKAFHVAGFDPLTYAAVSSWDTEYNVYRHPLLAFFMYIPHLINRALIALTGINCVQYIVAIILVFCAFYSFIFLFRIFREVIKLKTWDATLLSAFYFSFAYIMISAMVPDHFIMSMMLLLMTLYISGIYMQKGRRLTTWQTILLFVFTAGVSLNNGLKTFLAALFTNGKKFFRPKYLLLGVILPAALMWVVARVEYRTFVWPKEMARHQIKMKKSAEAHRQIYKQYCDTAQVKDSIQAIAAVKAIIRKKAHEKYVHDHKQIWNKNTGKPIAQGEFMRWTDITTSRSETAVENLFGEGIQLHRQYLLEDVLRSRPVIVRYDSPINYIVEGIILLLFALGIVAGIRSRFFCLSMFFFLFDIALHIGLGFGINEVYIMTAHYMFFVPIAIAFLLRRLQGSRLTLCRSVLIALTMYLFVYNGTLIFKYMLA